MYLYLYQYLPPEENSKFKLTRRKRGFAQCVKVSQLFGANESWLHSFGAAVGGSLRRQKRSKVQNFSATSPSTNALFARPPLWEGCSIYEGQLYFACTCIVFRRLYCIVFHLWPGGAPVMAKMGRSSGLRAPLPVPCWVMDLPLNQTLVKPLSSSMNIKCIQCGKDRISTFNIT